MIICLQAMRVFFLLRVLSLNLSLEREMQLPLTRDEDLIKSEDVLDLSGFTLCILTCHQQIVCQKCCSDVLGKSCFHIHSCSVAVFILVVRQCFIRVPMGYAFMVFHRLLWFVHIL